MRGKSLALAALAALSLAAAAPPVQPMGPDGLPQEGQQQVSGRVLGLRDKQLYLEVDGMAVPFALDDRTSLQGQRQVGWHRIAKHFCHTFSPGEQVRASYQRQGEKNVAASVERQ